MRRVFITGANRGIGQALAIRYARAGCHVYIGSRNAEQARDTLAQVTAAGGSGVIIPVDMLNDSSMVAAADRVQSDGPLDILVNNAGILQTARFTEQSADNIARLFTVNTIAPLLFTRLFLPQMIRQQSGLIVNHASVAIIGVPGTAVYSATKAALFTFSEALRRELRSTGVRVSTLLTPVVATDMSHSSEAVRRERGWYKSHRAVQKTMTLERYIDVIFPKLEKGKSVIAPGIAGFLTRLQRFAPHLVDLGLSMVFRPMYEDHS